MNSYSNSKVFKNLPSFVEARSNKLIGLPPVDATKSEKELVTEFIQSNSDDTPLNEIEDDLNKTYLLGGRISRVRPHKSLNKKKSQEEPVDIPNRGKKRMTCAEKRRKGLVRLNKHNKTFQMFIPIHKMWKEYASNMLGLKHYVETNQNGKEDKQKNFMLSLQNKLKKIEYYGSLLKVTQSRCSEYIGIQGIVIQETKNTFTFITVDNSVKVVPKLHSEFSLVIYNIGFSILGNHLHQRPVDRAKQNFKKHCMWL